LAVKWAAEVDNGYDIDKGLADLTELANRGDGEVFILTNGGRLVGALGITILDMFFTFDFYSAVRYWYVEPKSRYLARSLIAAAKKWSKENGCAKMLVCSNKLSLPADDFYEAIGFEEFERVYIGDL
jgi:GNAT superfamily N-acetyltransferase